MSRENGAQKGGGERGRDRERLRDRGGERGRKGERRRQRRQKDRVCLYDKSRCLKINLSYLQRNFIMNAKQRQRKGHTLYLEI